MMIHNQAIAFVCIAFVSLCICLVSSLQATTISQQRHQSQQHVTVRETNEEYSSSIEVYSPNDNNMNPSRRTAIGNFFKSLIAGTAASTSVVQPQVVEAADNGGLESVYFGVGCFWHIQHEFIEAERSILNRSVNELTSKAGYAGGTKTDRDGRVCYHNIMGVADYGKLGHGEVVGMDIPVDKIGEFSEVYFSLYNPKTKDRVDPLDKGPEYRSLIGLPGGVDHPSYAGVLDAATNAGFTLKVGNGNDPDTLGKQIVYVYDTRQFPFYQAEVYHQYHDDFQSPPYGREYNKLADKAFAEGRIKTTGCPDRV